MNQLIDSSEASQFDRLPPSAIDAERSVLGSMMLDRQARDTALAIIGNAGRNVFYQTDHQIIFDCILKLHQRNNPIDIVILRDELIRVGLFEEIGGTEYLAAVLESVPSAAHCEHYAQIVREKWMLRSIIATSNEALRRAYAPLKGTASDGAAQDIINDLMARYAGLVQRGTGGDIIHISEALSDAHESIEKVSQGKGDVLIPTGFRDVDEIGGGIGAGEMMIVGARPSVGKSTLGRQIAIRAARRGVPVGVISMEEDRLKLGRNWLSAESSIENHQLRRGDLSNDQWYELADGMLRIGGLPIYISDRAFSMNAIRADAARMVAEHGIRMLIVDHLQKIRIDGRTRYEKVTNASLEISGLIKELRVAGVVQCQLSRDPEKRSGNRPTIADLRESGQIEQDADIILLLHREDYYRSIDPQRQHEERDSIAELIVAKWRDAKRGMTVKLKSELQYQRFDDIDVEVPNVP